MRKICVVTGTRAEYGLLRPLLYRIREDKDSILCLVVTGMHLSPEFGLTYQEIEKDGFSVFERNEMLLSSDTVNGVAKSTGLGMIGFSDIYMRAKPDIVVLLGDRFETFAAASAAMLHAIPIAHIHGGELTQGAVDELMRHAITKMSTLHFTAAECYRKRVIQMGEQPENVYCVGALGIENIKTQSLLSKTELEKSIGFSLEKPFVIVTYHPATLEATSSVEQFKSLLEALSVLPYRAIFTKANADAEGKTINQMIDEYAENRREDVIAFTSMGMIRYLSALRLCRMVIGNSSSGIIEAPSFHIPTVNIGTRQQGRARAASVIDCGNSKEEIIEAVRQAEDMYRKGELNAVTNPCEGENTSEVIYEKIVSFTDAHRENTKPFFELDF